MSRQEGEEAVGSIFATKQHLCQCTFGRNKVYLPKTGNTKGGKHHCTINLMFDWFGISCMTTIDIKSLQNRLLKVCYVPVTSAGLPMVSFFFSFLFFLLLQPLTVLMNQTRQAVRAVKQSIFLDVYDDY